MTPTIQVTRADLRTVQAFQTLAACAPESARAAHLATRAEALAERIRRALQGEA